MKIRLFLVLLAISSCFFSAVGAHEVTARQAYGWSLARFVRESAADAVRTGQFLTFLDMISDCQEDGLFRARPLTGEEKEIFVLRSSAALILFLVNGITFKARLTHALHLDAHHRPNIINLGTNREVMWDFLWNGIYACMMSVVNGHTLYRCLSDNYVVLDRSHRGERCLVCSQTNPEDVFITPCNDSSHYLCVQCYRDFLVDGEYTCFICQEIVPEQRIVAEPPSAWSRLRRCASTDRAFVFYILFLELSLLWSFWIDIQHCTQSTPMSMPTMPIGFT